jgi:hypothetical protein
MVNQEETLKPLKPTKLKGSLPGELYKSDQDHAPQETQKPYQPRM